MITAKTTKDSHKIITFDFIKNEDMKFTAKLYAYYRLGKVKPRTVRGNINGQLPLFIEYCDLKNIDSLNEITKEMFLNYSLWLKEKKKVAPNTGYNRCSVVEEIIKIGQIKGWNVPKTNIFVDFTSLDLWDTKKALKENKTKPMPEDIFDKILYYAVNKETDILTKAGIIIQSQTGLRAKEIKSKLDEQFRGKTEQEIDDIVSNLSKSMSFNPLPTGVCLYDFRRGNCSDGDGCFFYNCPNYVTEVKFYPILKQELDIMEKEMARYKELGNNVPGNGNMLNINI